VTTSLLLSTAKLSFRRRRHLVDASAASMVSLPPKPPSTVSLPALPVSWLPTSLP